MTFEFLIHSLTENVTFLSNFFLSAFVLDKMSLLWLRVGYMEQFTLFKTLSNADKIPRFCSYSPLVYERNTE